MNIKGVIYMLTVMLLLSCAATEKVFAETRNIYVGDIVSLEIETSNLYEDELREKFHDFEIVELQRTSEGYLLSLRTFNVGENKVIIGDKELVISVASTLSDIERDDIFDGEADVLQAGFYFHWRLAFYLAAGVFLLSAIAVLAKTFIKKKVKEETPYETFMRCANNLLAENDNYLVDLTFYFKEYIGKIKHCRIIGKTSAEIVAELKTLSGLDSLIPDVGEWLTECDKLKFAQTDTSVEEKRLHYTQLLKIAEKIETNEGMT